MHPPGAGQGKAINVFSSCVRDSKSRKQANNPGAQDPRDRSNATGKRVTLWEADFGDWLGGGQEGINLSPASRVDGSLRVAEIND